MGSPQAIPTIRDAELAACQAKLKGWLVPDGMLADHTTTHCDVLLPLTASSTGAKSCASAELEAAGAGKVKKASILL